MGPENRWCTLHFLLTLAAILMFCAPARPAQAGPDPVSLDDISSQLAKEITQAHLRSAVVADFLTAEGKPSDLGWYLAAKFSDTWVQHQQEFRLLDRSELADARVSADDARSSEGIKRIGQMWGVDAIVTGSVAISVDKYVLTATVIRVADGATMATASQPILHCRILDLLSPQGFGVDGGAQARGGVNGTGVPSCLFCPNPGYSGKASRAKIQSSVVLAVTVSKDGRAARIGILKNPGYGLTEMAIEAVSQWHFKPAMSKEGAPISVVVPVEVSFRMTRS
jgi:TonB family protein